MILPFTKIDLTNGIKCLIKFVKFLIHLIILKYLIAYEKSLLTLALIKNNYNKAKICIRYT